MSALEFSKRFNAKPNHKIFSPSRVNLMGDHTDYCGGKCMPFAITYGTEFWLRTNESGVLEVYTDRFKERDSFPLNVPVSRKKSLDWRDYVYGVISALGGEKIITGGQLYVKQSIASAGLASSASFCAGLAKAICPELSLIEIAEISRKAEKQYVGVMCGPMDQLSICLGGGLQLSSSDLTYKTVAPLDSKYRIVILDTMVSRSLVSSGYNERYEEMLEVSQLAGLGRMEEIVDIIEMPELSSEILSRRLRHVLSESERVDKAADAISSESWKDLGRLMNESHESLRNDYQVSCPELDEIVELAREQNGVLGARLTGAGFGGCAIALSKTGSVERWRGIVEKTYKKRFGMVPMIYEIEMSEGLQLTRLAS